MNKLLATIKVFIISTLFLSAQEPTSPFTASFPDYQRHKRETMFNLDWISVGPVFNSARVDALQIDPLHPATMYAGFSSGNLWKTTNNGLSWKPVFSDNPSISIGDFAIAPSNPDIIYLGTGDNLKKPRNFTIPGNGVYRSDNGGETWKYIGLSDSWHIAKIRIHPENPEIAYVAVLGHLWSTNKNRGIYRTIDGGRSWEHVLYIDEKTGGNDIVISQSNPDVLYATMWEMYPGISGPNSSVYKSNDGGKSWTKLNGGLPDGPNTGRIGVAVSYSNPNKAYVLVDNLNKDKDPGAEIYRTLDGGKSWKRTHSEELMLFPGIGWYFTNIYVNPQDDEEIYGMGVKVAHSSNGGKTFDFLSGNVYHIFPSTADFFHLDQTEMWIDPADPKHIAVGNDGGLYTSYDKGLTWMHYNNIPSGEFYHIATGPGARYNIYGGTQDNATVYGKADEWNPAFPDKWRYVWLDAWSGGDGCVTQVDQEDPNTVYFSSQHGGIMRKDLKSGRSKEIQPALPTDFKGVLAFNYIAPYFISPHNRLTLYHAGNYLFKSLNRGDEWELISGDLSAASDPGKKSTAAGAIAESPVKPGIIYAGTDKGAFWVTMNDGVTWEEHSIGLPNNYIRSICPSKYKESRVYVTLTGINYDDLKMYVYVSEDYGKTWTSLNGNLPEEIANVIVEDPTNENILYLGTIRGIYISLNRGSAWSMLGTNLPSVPVSDIEIQKDAMDITIATYGRGIYKMSLDPVYEFALKGSIKAENLLLSVPEATLPWLNDTHSNPDLRTMEKVPFSFTMAKEGKASLTVVDKNGDIIWTTSVHGVKGLNQYRWDLIVKRSDVPQAYFYAYQQFIKPGIYKVVLEIGSIKQDKELIVKERTETPDENL